MCYYFLQGFRAPYLQTGGDATFIALNNLGMNFDSSLPSIKFRDPPVWPYTLDYGITQVRCSNTAISDVLAQQFLPVLYLCLNTFLYDRIASFPLVS